MFYRKLHRGRRTLGVGDGSHGPLGGLIVAILVVSAWPWEFDPIEFDVAAGGGELHGPKGTSLPMWVLIPREWVALNSTKLSIL